MKRIAFIATILLVTVCSKNVFAQTEAEMKAMMDFMTPGEMHKMLAKADGKWEASLEMWMQPGTPSTKWTSTAENTMIMGGRYQSSSIKGEFMGMPFEGNSLTGWDNARKIFVSTWIDNMGTGIIYMEGTWDEKTKTINLKGKQTDPSSGKVVEIREVFTWVDDDTQTMEMYMPDAAGKEFKGLVVKYKRVK